MLPEHAWHADPENVPDNPDDWLDRFQTFSIYEILPQIVELWGMNVEQQVEAKKTSRHRPGNDNAALPAPVRAAGPEST